jgi:hypothetical protein
LAPTIKQPQAAGNTTLCSLAERGGNWDQTQVRRLLARI